MSDNPQGSTNAAAAAGQGASASPKPAESVDITAALDALRGQITSLTSGYTGLRSLMDRRFAQLQGARSAGADGASEQADPGIGATGGLSPEEAEELRRDSKIARFLQDFPEARDHWSDILALVRDEARVDLVTAYNPRGQVDYYKSYRNALREVQTTKYEAARAAAASVGAAAQRDNATARAQAASSGGGNEGTQEATGTVPTIEELEAMNPEDALKVIEKHGLKQYFPGLTG